MKTFIRLCATLNVPKDGYYYPRAYEIVNELL